MYLENVLKDFEFELKVIGDRTGMRLVSGKTYWRTESTTIEFQSYIII